MQDFKQNSNVLGPFCERPLLGDDVLVRIEPDLDDVVDQGKERSQGESSSKQHHIAVLNN